MDITNEMIEEFLQACSPRHTPSGQVARIRVQLVAVLAMPEVRAASQGDRCPGCPLGCNSCTHDVQCECYEHQELCLPPEYVKEARDADGDRWIRSDDDPAIWRMPFGSPLTWPVLAREYGPMTWDDQS